MYTFRPPKVHKVTPPLTITSQIQNGCILTKILNGVNSVDTCNCSRYVFKHITMAKPITLILKSDDDLKDDNKADY